MSIMVTMAALSPTMEEGAPSEWLVNPGGRVCAGDVIAKIETGEAKMQRETGDEGVVGALPVAEGFRGVKVGTPIALHLATAERSAARQPTRFLPPPPRRHRRGSGERR